MVIDNLDVAHVSEEGDEVLTVALHWRNKTAAIEFFSGDVARELRLSSTDDFYLLEYARWMISDEVRLYAAISEPQLLIDSDHASGAE